MKYDNLNQFKDSFSNYTELRVQENRNNRVNLTNGDVTGNVSGTAATVTTAAQGNITSLGTLTTLSVDNITVNGNDISSTDTNGNITLTANFSPGTLEILKYLGYLNISTAKILWVFFEIISLFSFFFVLKKVLKFDYEWRNLLILFFSFGATVFTSFISGNISFILYGFISLSIYCLYKRFFNYYYLIIIFVSLFKFYYLSFLIIPFYLQGLKSINKIFLSIFLFIFIQYFFYINNPNLTLDFLDVIQCKYFDNLPVRMQTGSGLYSIIEKLIGELETQGIDSHNTETSCLTILKPGFK